MFTSLFNRRIYITCLTILIIYSDMDYIISGYKMQLWEKLIHRKVLTIICIMTTNERIWVLWIDGFGLLLVISNCDICVISCPKVADVGTHGLIINFPN